MCERERESHAPPPLPCRPSRGDSLERLWNSVEVFCRDITELDLQQLREYMSKDSKLFDIPPLGEHYARQWATGDLESEQEAALSGTTEGIREGGCSVTAAPPPPPSVCFPLLCVPHSDPLYRRLDEPPMKPSSDPLGPLTQRLVAVCLHRLCTALQALGPPENVSSPTPPHVQWSLLLSFHRHLLRRA